MCILYISIQAPLECVRLLFTVMLKHADYVNLIIVTVRSIYAYIVKYSVFKHCSESGRGGMLSYSREGDGW